MLFPRFGSFWQPLPLCLVIFLQSVFALILFLFWKDFRLQHASQDWMESMAILLYFPLALLLWHCNGRFSLLFSGLFIALLHISPHLPVSQFQIVAVLLSHPVMIFFFFCSLWFWHSLQMPWLTPCPNCLPAASKTLLWKEQWNWAQETPAPVLPFLLLGDPGQSCFSPGLLTCGWKVGLHLLGLHQHWDARWDLHVGQKGRLGRKEVWPGDVGVDGCPYLVFLFQINNWGFGCSATTWRKTHIKKQQQQQKAPSLAFANTIAFNPRFTLKFFQELKKKSDILCSSWGNDLSVFFKSPQMILISSPSGGLQHLVCKESMDWWLGT